MKQHLSLFLIVFLVVACIDSPEENSKSPINQEIQQVVSNLYDSIHYDGNKQPDWEKFSSLFIKGAFLIHVTDTAYTYMSSQDFIEQYRGQIESGIIQQASEHEVHLTAEKFADIAQLFSTYETEVITSEDTLNNRGINSIQLLQSDEQWKIASIIWYDETEENLIPDLYQP